jgi:hypothetical protein
VLVPESSHGPSRDLAEELGRHVAAYAVALERTQSIYRERDTFP